jgi:hypothetical protein
MRMVPKFLLLAIGLMSASLEAQSNSDQFEGEYFTAKVMNVTVAKQNGNVFVSVLFQGKAFDENRRVSLGRTGEKADDCAALLDSSGGQYVAVKCLPLDSIRRSSDGIAYVNSWDGQGGLVLRPNVDAVHVFQFRPVERAALEVGTTFDLSSSFYLNICVWHLYTSGAGCANFVGSEQSLSFFNLKAR